ncbi:OmpA family protein [Flavobacterium lacus]|uniref:Outer membrane protein OmpA-like peptidoglycan-associated protein n=1 Tax=Flavobacterium lacus TaxID=1353778 RepID=A0A328WUW5_9FLAO|nr:hypothetical protein [Flavobacterium lacus]RAR47654.1 hypothetical protein B0I10_108157 [Flavobacterium lacus]
MDGNKKLIRLGVGLFTVFLIGACTTQQPNYINLYVDTVNSKTDALVADSTKLVLSNTTSKAVTGEALAYSTTTDSLLHQEDLATLLVVSDFLKELHTQLDSTYFGRPNDTLSGSTRYSTFFQRDSIPLELDKGILRNTTVNAEKASEAKTSEFLVGTFNPHEENMAVSKEVQSAHDSLPVLKRQEEVKPTTAQKTKTVVVDEVVPVVALSQVEQKKDVLQPQTVISTTDSLAVVKRQMELKPAPQVIKETVTVEKAAPVVNVSNEKDTVAAMRQQLEAQDGTIQALEQQLKTPPQPTVQTERIYVDRMVPVVVSKTTKSASTTSDKQVPDEAKTEAVVPEPLPPVRVPVVVVSDTNAAMEQQLQVKKDSIVTLQKLLQAKQKTKTDTVYQYKESDEKATPVIDTTTLTAYYKIGQREPNPGLFAALFAAVAGKSVVKVEISGFTDSSGNAAINKRLTEARINHLCAKLTPYVAVEKLFVQNFGQTFASDDIVAEERRVEIKVYTKN